MTPTAPPTTTAAPTLSVFSLNQLASQVAAAALDPAMNATSLDQLVAASLPAALAGRCAYMLDGQVVELTTAGLLAYGATGSAVLSNMIASVQPCGATMTWRGPVSWSCCFLSCLVIYLLLPFGLL
jgi:hypothetical protein